MTRLSVSSGRATKLHSTAPQEFGRDETSLIVGEDVSILKSSDGLGWTGLYAALTQERPHAAAHRAIPDIWLASAVTAIDVRRASSSGHTDHGVLPGGLTSILPAGESVRDEIGASLVALHVFLRSDVLREVADEMFPKHRVDDAILPVFAANDPVLALLLQAIRASLNEPAGSNALKLEYLQRALAAQLLSKHSVDSGIGYRSSRDGLNPRQIHRVVNHIRENLETPLPLAELAAIAGTSRTQFIRRFTASFRKTPHQYVMEARVQRAALLLLDRKRALAEIAIACGFSSQAHFGTIFKRLTQVSPAVYRALHGS